MVNNSLHAKTMMSYSEYDAQVKALIFATKLVSKAVGDFQLIFFDSKIRKIIKYIYGIRKRGWVDYDNNSLSPELEILFEEVAGKKVKGKYLITQIDEQKLIKLNIELKKVEETT